MGAAGSANERWARSLSARRLPGEPFRWELYDSALREALDGSGRWCDLGAGGTDFIAEHARPAFGVGVDRRVAVRAAGPFVAAELCALPFRDSSFGVAALRFVVEHLEEPENVFRECRRVLSPGGRLLLMTTNRRSVLVSLAGIFPGGLRRRLISRLYRVPLKNVLPVYHRWNTPARLAAPPEGFSLERLEFVEALDWSRRPLFRLLLGLAVLTRPRALRKLRSNVLAVYRKNDPGN